MWNTFPLIRQARCRASALRRRGKRVSAARIFTERYLVAAALSDDAHPDLLNKKASDEILEPFFKEAFARFEIYNSLPKDNFYLLAGVMTPYEVHSDVRKMLDAIVKALS